MKKKSFKNYIAFTLMEMTLVLLITSVIAAATTPIITSAVSDSAAKGGKDTNDYLANPWKVSNLYNGGGIYSVPINNTSFIGINVKPGAYAATYQYPSLLVNSYATTNIVRSPQIVIESNNAISSINPNNATALKIGMDEYENILMAYENFSFDSINNSSASTDIGYRSIYIGSRIQDSVPVAQLKTANSVLVGYNVGTYYASYAVNIGANIARMLQEQDVVNIGSDLYASHATYSSMENVIIGTKTNAYGMGRYNVMLGNYAGSYSNAIRNVIIGSYAGNSMSADYYKNYDNIIIGYYALNRPSNNSNSFKNNVVIGKYASSRLTDFSSDYFYNSITIGSYAGAYKNLSGGVGTLFDSILIGDYAGMYSFDSAKNDAIHKPKAIMIGNYAGYNSSSNTGKNIFIGKSAGQNSKSGESIYIGNYAGMNTTASANSNYSNIAIGYYAGYASDGFYNIYIGSYAGYGAKGNYNVGIGVKACSNLSSSASKKWCLGYGTISSDLSKDGTSTNIWSKSNGNAQMVIGFTDVAVGSQNVVLYANKVYRWNATTMDKVSDRRFKTNIVPSKHSIKDIRKINIYEYNFKADKNKSPKIGVIAQEYKKVFPNDVVRDSATKKLALSVDWMIYTMVNAVKDVDNELKYLQNSMKVYINDFSDLKTRIVNLEKQAQQIKAENEEIKSHLARVNKQLR